MRLLHTADWQIGMTRSYLPPEAQQRLTTARTEVVRRIGALASEQGCDLVVVAGDVFEHNQLTPQTVRRALEALREVPVPVYLLPGNHDHLGPMSVWSSPLLREELPEHVRILDTAGVVQVAEGVELVAAPWTGKHPVSDPVAGALDLLPEGPSPEGTVRIVVGHGGVDLLDRDQHNTVPVAVEPLVSALSGGRVHYVALGDRHSCTQVGDPAIWYSGAPEPTDWREQRPGEVLVVDVEPGPPGHRGTVEVRPQRVARWTYLALARRVDSEDDLEALDRELGLLPGKERTVLRLGLRGTLGLAQHARLEEILERHADLLAALHRPEQHNDVVLVDDDDLGELGLGGFLASALEEIRGEAAAASGPPSEQEAFRPGLPDDEASARDALSLLYRLTRGGSR
ncbi:exonuclease SbcCD subunit D [Ornithinimicrobium pratense]|uniref:Nuclease SbcCD subunit D n=1 Tax=Ornithinimicrobium pratense TaxID=2593973 RepID=A0A5J6VA18_9MICO|nr:exonuclease SbcCD subunit D [Ornithinimicrobium pratense]